MSLFRRKRKDRKEKIDKKEKKVRKIKKVKKEKKARKKLGLIAELKNVRWPKPKELAKNSFTVIVFMLFLGIFFLLCQVVTSEFLSLIGM